MEEHINDLQARTDEASPEDTPHDLYHIAQVIMNVYPSIILSYILQDLMEGITKNESLYKSVTTTVQNLIHDFNDKKVSSDELSAQLIQLQQNWDTLNTNLNALHNQLKEESDQLDEYLMKLSSFSEKLNAAYSELYDEYCTSIAPNASSETIAKQKQKIAVRQDFCTAEKTGLYCFLLEIHCTYRKYGRGIERVATVRNEMGISCYP